MPGFAITQDPTTNLAPTPRMAFYAYAWKINNLFGTPTAPHSPVIYAQSATLPTFTANTDTIQGASLNYKYADNITWEDVRITFYDVAAIPSVTIVDQLRQWREKVWSVKYGIGSASSQNEGNNNSDIGYKKISQISSYACNDPKQVFWTMFGSWPQSIRYGDLSYTTSDVRIVEVVVTYDFAEEGIDALANLDRVDRL